MSSDPNLEIRLERARSWISMAQKKDISDHARFIFYWIAFNSMYGLTPIDPDNLDKEPPSQIKEIRQFLTRVKEMRRRDQQKGTHILDKAVPSRRSDAKSLIEDHFLSNKYWEGSRNPPDIVGECKQDWNHVKDELDKNHNYDSLLHFTFFRLTILRNQIVHGSATASSESKGYSSLQPAVRFLQVMVPALLGLLERYGDHITEWPKAPYPRRGHRGHPHI